MNNKYNDYCMKFTNEELKEYMIDYLINKSLDKTMIRCLSEDGNEIEMDSSEMIETIVFDGEVENLFITFYGVHTSIFVYDEEIMFIDEHSKGIYTSSDIYKNVVYEGELRNLSHKEMLQMFSEIILCFIDSTDVSMTQLDVSENMYKRYNYYRPHVFDIAVQNNHLIKKEIIYDNIIIRY